MQCLQPFYGVLLLELLIFHTQVEFEQIYALNAELFSKPKMNLRSASRKTMATPPARVRVQFVGYYQWYALPPIAGASLVSCILTLLVIQDWGLVMERRGIDMS